MESHFVDLPLDPFDDPQSQKSSHKPDRNSSHNSSQKLDRNSSQNRHNLDHQPAQELPTTERELRGWYSFGFAVEGYSALAIAVYFPILLEGLAASVAKDAITGLKCDTSTTYDCLLLGIGILT